jgi:hypothetical protein
MDSGSEVTPSADALPDLEVKGEPVTFFRQRPEGTRDACLPEKALRLCWESACLVVS